MAIKKIKSDVAFETLSNDANGRIPYIDIDGNLVNSSVQSAELGHLSGVTSALQGQIDAKLASALLGVANGVAELDAGGKVPASQLPSSVMEYQGSWAASTNTPTLADGAGNAGDVYIASDAGSVDFDGAGAREALTFAAGDWIIYNGAIWEKSSSSDAVQSVAGKTGTVLLDADDIDDAATVNKFVVAGDITKLGFISVTQAVDLDAMEAAIVLNDAKVSADGSVVSHSDVTSAGSGIIISAAERTKLDGIEALATADQTGAEIKAAYEAEANTNAYDDAAVSKLAGIEALATADQTGAEIKAAYEAEADTNAYNDAAVSKLAGIEAGADVTDIASVSAAGATMDSDISLAGNGYFLDEDNMTSDSATQVPSQQSVKAYVDAQAAASGNLSVGDIKQTSFAAANNVLAAADVTGLVFNNASVRAFDCLISVVIDATVDKYEVFRLQGIQKASGFDMIVESNADASGIVFSILASGQIQYTSGNEAGFVSSTMEFRADTLDI